ncbi:MAG: cupin domain-containing protein [Proteobacteria bacterium]|jgi:mannose-6-phosphate isomerase|nr:cupin domain-containing protein [Pseudomonadota bacterium]
MRIVEKPWGFEQIWAETDGYVAKMLHINPKQRLSLQYHNIKEETVYVIEGTLLNWTDEADPPQKYTAGAICHINPGQVHRFGAGKELVRLMEVSTPHLDDVVRLADDYDR